MSSSHRRPTPVLGILIGAVCVLILLLAGAWLLVGWSPGWFHPAGEDEAASAMLGEQVEFRLVEELQKIRPSDQVWRLRITDEAINAWLATRLGPWLTHQPSVQWPDRLSWPQVRFNRRGIDVGIRVGNLLGADRVVVLRFHPVIRDGNIDLRPGGVALGQLPIPFGRSALGGIIRQQLPSLEGAAGELVTAALGETTMEALIPLVDARRVQLDALGLERGAIVLEARTLPAQ
ncbi:MAG: hypothetical protein VX527_02030 [Planctomycetota bacterium]|nr:hypothetical protein [Planctomycetota bacterium]